MTVVGLRVVVIGAGIGGLAVARALALRGADVTLLDQASEITEVGAGLQISPNGFAVLRGLGLDRALVASSVQAQAVCLKDHSGAPVVRLDLMQLPDPAYYFVHRADLIDILARGAREAGVRIRLLQRVTSVDGGPQPVVHLANETSLNADLVIGADGLHSVLRPVLNGQGAPFFTGQVAWRAVVPNTAGRGAEAWVHMGPGRHVVSYPLRGGAALNIVAVQERKQWADEGWNHGDDPANLRAAFADFGAPLRDILDQVNEVRLWGLFRHPVARVWQRDHLALLGDAAHPTLPFLAQGASMALEDAWVLADAVARCDSIAAGLAAYQVRREGRVRRVIAAANGNAWKYHIGFTPLRLAAHTVMRLGGKLAPMRMMRQFDWLYTHDVTSN
ncbi:MAG: FAD-dependent oxidoreductase [Paracoccaceae bacterium]|uniref:FAD-dependent oxidoreductase n=1 Tax=Seohaeicola saemankumensis TaxID=481181 RepID=UPI001E2A7DA2|nr:FAD-dependent oxidoreductase [Seohaeicola saemankumensis]MCD1627927.1 FAD-dependent oxidoreductase [Seohaeicola saemankumensis]